MCLSSLFVKEKGSYDNDADIHAVRSAFYFDGNGLSVRSITTFYKIVHPFASTQEYIQFIIPIAYIQRDFPIGLGRFQEILNKANKVVFNGERCWAHFCVC